MLVRKFLCAHSFRYRLYVKDFPSKPDIVLPKYKTAIFVHGCFWHGHKGCKYFVIPKTRTEWWLNKINRNKDDDTESQRKLHLEGWKVLTIFECELKLPSREDVLYDIVEQIKSGDTGN